MSKTRKYTGWNRTERAILGGATNQFASLIYTCEDQGGETIVSVHAEVAISAEPGFVAQGAFNVAGYARLVVNRSGNAIPVIATSSDWDDTTTANLFNDEDAGDTWAITPFAISTASTATVVSVGGNVHLTLSPKTKRSLRKGDVLQVEIQYSNGGTADSVVQESVTGTLFVQGD